MPFTRASKPPEGRTPKPCSSGVAAPLSGRNRRCANCRASRPDRHIPNARAQQQVMRLDAPPAAACIDSLIERERGCRLAEAPIAVCNLSITEMLKLYRHHSLQFSGCRRSEREPLRHVVIPASFLDKLAQPPPASSSPSFAFTMLRAALRPAERMSWQL
jgi:hypothetical protein